MNPEWVRGETQDGLLEPPPLYFIAKIGSDGKPVEELHRIRGTKKVQFVIPGGHTERFTMDNFTRARKSMIDLCRLYIPELPTGLNRIGLYRVWNTTLMVTLPIYNEVSNVQKPTGDSHQYVL